MTAWRLRIFTLRNWVLKFIWIVARDIEVTNRRTRRGGTIILEWYCRVWSFFGGLPQPVNYYDKCFWRYVSTFVFLFLINEKEEFYLFRRTAYSSFRLLANNCTLECDHVKFRKPESIGRNGYRLPPLLYNCTFIARSADPWSALFCSGNNFLSSWK